ncbi:hypothetical protein GBAR_LOCUS10597 [Geodia barretti]|uniref:Uncharacterized protein n=1 Tax=Geodia barretti TaxID=519541 RepID=A0AA35WEF3_GEOBA|nr:hypothetical protein GBAR_LOCUS10597 [Geodia barretti]
MSAFGETTCSTALSRCPLMLLRGHCGSLPCTPDTSSPSFPDRVARFRGMVTDAFANLSRFFENIISGDGNASATRRHKTGEDSHCRCLSGSIRTEEADNLSLVYLEGDVLECLKGTVVFGDILNFNHF